MKKLWLICILLVGCKITQQSTGVDTNQNAKIQTIVVPYQTMGWTDEEAAGYLIDKLTFGNNLELRDQILEQGINSWLTQQLNPSIYKAFEEEVNNKFPVTALSLKEIAKTYPGLIVTLRTIAVNNRMSGSESLRGQINFNEMFGTTLRHVQNVDRIWFYEMENGQVLKAPIKRLELGNFMELMYQMAAQKMYRATYAENQIEERLVDFWFNHFNVSITRINDVATNVLSYERDAIRPNVLGQFDELLKATAQHPAMLTYLDNTISNADENAFTLSKDNNKTQGRSTRQQPGINENYARELLELHTLGVDGGYTQKDVEEVARIFTGWKTSPLLYPIPKKFEKVIEKRITADGHSFITNGFYFDASRHDAGPKQILGKEYQKGKGTEEGHTLLEQLTSHPSTAKHIALKMVTYFVDDTPNPLLLEKVEKAFATSNGNLKTTFKAMIEAPEFWDKTYIKSKAKTPFEFIVSTLRESDAKIKDATSLLQWSSKMGQPLYGFQPPTGYPTEQEFWINESSIAQRIKFAYLLNQDLINGVQINSDDDKTEIASLFASPQFQKK